MLTGEKGGKCVTGEGGWEATLFEGSLLVNKYSWISYLFRSLQLESWTKG